MVAAPTMSPRGTALARTFQAALAALSEHGKQHPAEMQQLADMLHAHMRAAWPMSMSLPDPALTPAVLLPLHIPLDGGAFVEISRGDDGRLVVYSHDDTQHDSIVMLTTAQASVVCRALGATQ